MAYLAPSASPPPNTNSGFYLNIYLLLFTLMRCVHEFECIYKTSYNFMSQVYIHKNTVYDFKDLFSRRKGIFLCILLYKENGNMTDILPVSYQLLLLFL